MPNTEIFPDKHKVAKINPIHKIDDETISLLPVMSNILEKGHF